MNINFNREITLNENPLNFQNIQNTVRDVYRFTKKSLLWLIRPCCGKIKVFVSLIVQLFSTKNTTQCIERHW